MVEIEKPRIECVENPGDASYGKYVVEPLERGYGTTLGNSLRRILLSSLPGTAVTSIKIAGVQHEFTTIPGVKEDVTEIVLNVKSIIAKLYCEGVKTVHIEASGACKVTAGDIKSDGEVEVLNPELHLATLDVGATLSMEITLSHGRGYVSAAQNKDPQAEISRIPIDSIYSPVVKVTYKVEATRVEQRTDFDRLVIDVETKAAITPRDALASAGKTLVELFGLMRELNEEAEGIEVGPSTTDATLAADLALPIENLNLQSRSYNALRRRGILTVGELVAHSEADLLDIRNFGTKSIEEIKESLAALGMTLKDSVMPSFGDSESAAIFSDDQSI